MPLAEVEGDLFAVEPWCWVLSGARHCRPVPFTGQVSLFSVPNQLLEPPGLCRNAHSASNGRKSQREAAGHGRRRLMRSKTYTAGQSGPAATHRRASMRSSRCRQLMQAVRPAGGIENTVPFCFLCGGSVAASGSLAGS